MSCKAPNLSHFPQGAWQTSPLGEIPLRGFPGVDRAALSDYRRHTFAVTTAPLIGLSPDPPEAETSLGSPVQACTLFHFTPGPQFWISDLHRTRRTTHCMWRTKGRSLRTSGGRQPAALRRPQETFPRHTLLPGKDSRTAFRAECPSGFRRRPVPRPPSNHLNEYAYALWRCDLPYETPAYERHGPASPGKELRSLR